MNSDTRRSGSGLMALAAALRCPWPSAAATDPEMFSLEELMSINVIGTSKYEQRQEDVAAAVVVITREDIRSFGWRTLDGALVMLPGVYNTCDRQYHYPGVRGFGLPGDYSTRLLITINGNRANDPLYDARLFDGEDGYGYPAAADWQGAEVQRVSTALSPTSP